jgi:hypothetical protein
MAGTWQALKNQPGFSADTMLLLTDGTVMCHEYNSANWHKLTPDSTGDYVNGSWSSLAALPTNSNIPSSNGGPTDAPLYFYSAVLRDGRVLTAGGEYNSLNPNSDNLAAQIYDPTTNQWTTIATPKSWTQIGDAPGCVLPDGRVLLGSIEGNAPAIYDPVANSWVNSGANGNKNDSSSEETWTLLSNGTVLVAECTNHPNAERYLPAEDQWLNDGPTKTDLVEASSIEIGPAILLPDGRVFALGATGTTNLYTMGADATKTGTWASGPNIPNNREQTGAGAQLIAKDAPACLLPNGRVLFTAGPATSNCNNATDQGYCEPTFFFEFDVLADAGSQMNAAPTPPNAGLAPFNGRMLLVPSGQVLFANTSGDIEVYTPDGNPSPTWAPTITSFPSQLQTEVVYALSGTQLNGLSQAVAYGDDASMATNYPIITITNSTTGKVTFCRTFNHSTMGVATGAQIVSTQFTVPAGTAGGACELEVTVNGISSQPVEVEVIDFGNLVNQRCLFWKGNFTLKNQESMVFYHPSDQNWWLATFTNGIMNWSLAGNTAGFGQVADGRPFWKGDFNGDGRDDILFYYPGDDNWWLGTFDSAGNLGWTLAGNTAGFGHRINDGRPFWAGNFQGLGKEQILFYYPGDDNWWLGTFSAVGNLTWKLVGNTAGFGHGINDGRPFWIGEFQGLDKDQVLFYYPGDDNWWLGTFDGSGNLTWKLAGNTAGFGHGINDGRPFWVGDFSGVDARQMLFYYPGDDNWWLGTFDGSGNLTWVLAGNTRGFGHGIYNNNFLFWTGNFSDSFRDDVVFYYQGDSNWWDGSFSNNGSMNWKLAGNTAGFGSLITHLNLFWIGDFTGVNHDQVLFYHPADGHWWLGTFGNLPMTWGLVGSTGL